MQESKKRELRFHKAHVCDASKGLHTGKKEKKESKFIGLDIPQYIYNTI